MTSNQNSQSANESNRAGITQHRNIVAGSKKVLVHSDVDLGIEVFASDDGLWLVGFSAKRMKPDFNYMFKTKERAQGHMAEYIKGVKASHEAKQARKQAQRDALATMANPLAVGDVLVASWGYDQTNIDYYEITRMVGKCSVEIREIKKSASYDGQHMSGECVPMKGHYTGEPMIKRVNERGAVKVHSWGTWAYKKEVTHTVSGVALVKPDRFTTYA